MAKKLYNEDYIYDIACAIREKCGDEKAKFKTCDMADAIRDLEIGGGGGGTTPQFVFEGTRARSMFACELWNNIIENYGDQFEITVEAADSAFSNNVYLTDASNLTFTFVPKSNPDPDVPANNVSRMFYNCYRLTDLPTIEGECTPIDLSYMFYTCWSLQNVPSRFFREFDWSFMEENVKSSTPNVNGVTIEYDGFYGMLENCRSLRSFPVSIFKHDCPTRTKDFYWERLLSLYAMDKMRNLPIPYTSPLSGKSIFSNTTFSRLSEFTFEMDETDEDNPVPLQRNWSEVTLNLSYYVGYCPDYAKESLLEWGGFEESKEVTSVLSYEELKEEDDWFTCDINFSRYNHDSAVNTINSLPDTTSSTIGRNIVQFKSASGAATDGGPISSLTESEIAVAAAKGWTVTLVD